MLSTGNSYSHLNSFDNYSQNRYSIANNNFGLSPYSGYSGFNSYSSPNTYPNNYSKPIPQGAGNQHIPQPTMRQDVWGFLNGFQAMLNVLYAGTGIVHCGKIFVKMTYKLIKAICGKSLDLIFKLTGFSFLKRMIQRLSSYNDWFGEFNLQENNLQNAWGNNATAKTTNKTLFGKFLLILRVTSLLGTLLILLLRNKAIKQESTIIHAEVRVPAISMKNTDQESNNVNLKNEAKLIGFNEDDSPLSNLKAHLQESVTEVGSPSQEKIIGNNENLSKDEIKILSVSQVDEVDVETPDITRKNYLLNKTENRIEIIPESNISIIEDNLKEQIVSEDFWKNKEVFKNIEFYQQEEKQKSEEKKAFEMPSVLKSLREKSGASSNKPWLMKKKTTAIEVLNIETPKEENLQIKVCYNELLESSNLSGEKSVVSLEESPA